MDEMLAVPREESDDDHAGALARQQQEDEQDNNNGLAVIRQSDNYLSTKVVRTSLRVASSGMHMLWWGTLIWLVSGGFLVSSLVSVAVCPRDERVQGGCVYPSVPLRGRVDLMMVASVHADAVAVKATEPRVSWLNVSNMTFESDVKVSLVAEVRQRGLPLTAHLYARAASDEEFTPRESFWVGSIPLTVARRVAERKRQRMLLETTEEHDDDETVGMTRPHWRFGSERLVIRLLDVGGDGALSRSALRDGLPTMSRDRLDVERKGTLLYYKPVVLMDDQAVLDSHSVMLSSNASFPDPTLRLKFTAVGPLQFGLRATVAVPMLAGVRAIMPGDDVDEVKWHLSDARIFRYAVTQAVTMAHISFDYLAFKEEMGYYVGRETFRGVSSAGLVWSFFRSIVIFLYLLDNDAGTVVLIGLFLSLFTDLFKLEKVLQPRVVLLKGPWFLIIYPTLSIREVQNMSEGERQTHIYDREATRHLTIALLPLLFGFATFTLVHDAHKGWYSWLISSLADVFYLFGFIAMTPQLYINYKLKSVAHLPIKVFLYKIFNTFIDDLFAMIVKMPMKHRVMTLRDDLVFVVFLYQWFKYPTDRHRANEFGFAAESESGVASSHERRSSNGGRPISDDDDDEEEDDEDEVQDSS